MGDETSGFLDGKALSSLRVVDLKHELEKRGLPKSGSKKELIKRLKQKLELEKLFSESSAVGGIEPRLQLDEATEQNEFVRQYLANQQKLYAQQKGMLEQQEKSAEEDEECEDDDEESDSGTVGHDSDVSENVGTVKNSCDSSTQEIAEEKGPNVQEESKTVVDVPQTKPKDNDPEVQITSKQDPVIVEPETVAAADASEKTNSDQENSSCGKPDSTSPCEEPSVAPVAFNIADIELPESPGNMHPKKSKLKKHNEKLRKSASTAEDQDASKVCPKANGSDSADSDSCRTHERKDSQSSLFQTPKENEQTEESENLGGGNGDPTVGEIVVPDRLNHEQPELEPSKEAETLPSEKKSDSPDSSMEIEPGKEGTEASENSSKLGENCEIGMEDVSPLDTTKQSHSVQKAQSQSPRNTEVETVQHADSSVEESDGTSVEKSVNDSSESITADSIPGHSKPTTENENSDSNADDSVKSRPEPVGKHSHRSAESSETEDGESKTDDESAKLSKKANFQTSPDSHDALEMKPPVVKPDRWKQTESDSSSESDSSGSDTRRRHKSYKSSKSESYFTSSSRKKGGNESGNVKDKSDAQVKEDESQSVTTFTPRRLKIKRSTVVPQESVIKEDKSSKREKSPVISPETTKREKSAQAEEKSPRREKISENSEGKTPKKEKSPRKSLDRGSSQRTKLSKHEQQSSRGIDQKAKDNIKVLEKHVYSGTKCSVNSRKSNHWDDSEDCPSDSDSRNGYIACERYSPKSHSKSMDTFKVSVNKNTSSITSPAKESSEKKKHVVSAKSFEKCTKDENLQKKEEASSKAEIIPEKVESVKGEKQSKQNEDPMASFYSSSVFSCSDISRLLDSFKASPSVKSSGLKTSSSDRKSSPSHAGYKKDEKKGRDKDKENTRGEAKKRPAEETDHVEHIPAKVTYRKLNIPFKKNEDKELEQREGTTDKKRLWRSYSSTLPKTAVNISTDSLKTIIPDFKVVCASSLNEAEDLLSPKVGAEAPSLLPKASKSRTNSYSEDALEKMEVDEPESQNVALKDGLRRDRHESKKEAADAPKRTVLSQRPVSKTLFIQNLVRPFTLIQLKEVLKRTGVLVEEEFWIDKIKSKCFVTYETLDQAEETRIALDGTRWPPSNPKILSVEFSSKEEMEYHKELSEQSKTSTAAALLEKKDLNAALLPDARRKRELEDLDREKEHSKQNFTYVREWDKDKIPQEESPDKEKAKDKPRGSEKKKDKKESKRRQEDDTPAKLLDDLFHKTKATPCIYWLPLTDEQVKEKEEQRRQRRLEREKRTQEEEERRARRKRDSRSRSRSPIRRR